MKESPLLVLAHPERCKLQRKTDDAFQRVDWAVTRTQTPAAMEALFFFWNKDNRKHGLEDNRVPFDPRFIRRINKNSWEMRQQMCRIWTMWILYFQVGDEKDMNFPSPTFCKVLLYVFVVVTTHSSVGHLLTLPRSDHSANASFISLLALAPCLGCPVPGNKLTSSSFSLPHPEEPCVSSLSSPCSALPPLLSSPPSLLRGPAPVPVPSGK